MNRVVTGGMVCLNVKKKKISVRGVAMNPSIIPTEGVPKQNNLNLAHGGELLNVVNNVVSNKIFIFLLKIKKQSTDRFVLSSFCETTSLLNFNKLINKYVWMENFFFFLFLF